MRQRPVSILCLLALFCLLAACSPKQDKKQEFMDHWKQLSQDSQGYSPAPSDLRPEPRVIMRHTEKQEQAASRPLPTIPVTLKLHNVDVGVALRSLAAAAGVNVMLSPGVSGTVSLNVQKSPWRDVFQGLLRANGLQYRWQGNILQVLTAVEKQKEINLQTLDNQLAQQELISRQNSPLTVSVVSVRYAEAAALQQSLTKFLTAANGQGGQAAVIEVDEHSNALIIQATEQDQQRIIRLVDNLDRPRPQVHLKAYIVEATKETARELGVQWGGVWRSGSFNNGNHAWIGSGASGTQGQDPVTGGLTGTHGSGLGGAPFGLDYSGIASNDMGSLGFLFGKVGGSMLEVQLNLMEKDGNINILSSPSITTLDNKMAYTENGEKVPYVSTSNMGDREVKFEDAVLAPRDDAQRHRRRQPQAQSAGQEGRSGHLPFRGRQSLHHQEADRNDPHHAQRRNRGHLRPDQGKGDGHQRGRSRAQGHPRRQVRLRPREQGQDDGGSAYLHHAGNPAHAGTAAAPVRAFHERKPFAPERGASRALGRGREEIAHAYTNETRRAAAGLRPAQRRPA